MSDWVKLIRPHASLEERVIGTYLLPYRCFPPLNWKDLLSATEIISRAQTSIHEVLVTRIGGLFIQPPMHMPDMGVGIDAEEEYRTKLAFEEEASSDFNQLICEFALSGIVSEPATPVHISVGRLIDNHALISSHAAGREHYRDRTIQPTNILISGNEMDAAPVSESTLEQACLLEKTSVLAKVSNTLPTLIAGAYSLFSRRQLSEALIVSWVAAEQMLDYLWRQYVSCLPDVKRRRRLLDDTRTFTAAVRTEILHTAGRIDSDMFDALNTARKHRNDMAHRAKISLQASEDGMRTMRFMIEHLCEASVSPPQAYISLNW